MVATLAIVTSISLFRSPMIRNVPSPALISRARNGEDVVLLRSLGHLPGVRFAVIATDPDRVAPWTEALTAAGWQGSHLVVPDERGSVSAAVAALAAEADGSWHVLWVTLPDRTAEVFRALGESSVRPWIVLVERSGDVTANRPASATKAGYAAALFDGVSQYYLAREHDELADPLSYPACSRDSFVALPADPAVGDGASLLDEVVHWRRLAVTGWADAVAASLVVSGESASSEAARTAQRELAAMHASTSWRVTRPLRATRRLLGRIRAQS